MLAGVTIVDPATTWIEPTVELEPDVDHPSVRRPPRAQRASRPALRSCPTPSPSTPDVGPGALVGPFCYLRPGTVLASRRKGGHLRGDQELDASGIGRRCRISRTSATPTSARTRTSAPARSPRTSRTSPASPKGRTTIGSNVRTAIHNGFVAPVEIGDGAWIAAGSVITKDVPPDALADRPLTPGEQGGVCSPAARRLSSSFPASKRREARDAAAAGPLDRARAAEAADGLLGPLAPGARRADRRAARRRARRDRAAHLRRTARPTAATTSRSAAPTSSSCRRLRARSTRT